jgi:hypothetical protein
MTSLYTVAYPELSAADAAFIEDLRVLWDPEWHSVVRAHFTLVFECNVIPASEYLAHIAAVAARTRPIGFVIDSVSIVEGPGSNALQVCLLAGEGCTRISRLHDDLYSGPLKPCLRLDLPYLPHVTIARSISVAEAECLCEELDSRRLRIEGWLRSLHVGELEEGVFAHRGRFDLAG